MSIERIVGVARWALIALLGIGGAAHAMPRIPQLAEVSIGHGLTADALEHGMAETVRRFLKACGW